MFATQLRAAAAAAAKAPARSYVRKVATPVRAAAVKKPTLLSASTLTAAPAAAHAASVSASASTSTSTSAPPASSIPSFDDFDDADFRLPEAEIGDYSSLRRASVSTKAPVRTAPTYRAPPAPAAVNPTPSPPLSALPDESYVPLPSASLGSVDMRDAYVFNEPAPTGVPGEIAAADWTTSFRGLSERPFEKEVAVALLKPLDHKDVEIKPDGLLYLPEIKYRRTLNAAFGPGGWGLAPRGETHVGPKIVSREWGLVCLGRLVAIARGEQEYFDPSGVPTATEACKSNALMRCCKDLGIASELWDPVYIRTFKQKYCVEAMVEHVVQKRKRKLWRKKDAKFDYPYKEISTF